MSEMLRDAMEISPATRKTIAEAHSLMAEADRVLAQGWLGLIHSAAA
jgi:hypothetical protein